jgi:hypothetical protein
MVKSIRLAPNLRVASFRTDQRHKKGRRTMPGGPLRLEFGWLFCGAVAPFGSQLVLTHHVRHHRDAQALMANDHRADWLVFDVEFQGRFAELTAKNSDVTRSIDRQGHAISGDPPNLNCDVVANVDLFANLAA